MNDEELKALEFTNSITTGFEQRIKKLYEDMTLILSKKPSPYIDTDRLYFLEQFRRKTEDYLFDAEVIE